MGWGNVERRHSNLTRSFTVGPSDKKQVACGYKDNVVVVVVVLVHVRGNSFGRGLLPFSGEFTGTR